MVNARTAVPQQEIYNLIVSTVHNKNRNNADCISWTWAVIEKQFTHQPKQPHGFEIELQPNYQGKLELDGNSGNYGTNWCAVTCY